MNHAVDIIAVIKANNMADFVIELKFIFLNHRDSAGYYVRFTAEQTVAAY